MSFRACIVGAGGGREIDPAGHPLPARQLVVPQGTPLARLYVSILAAFGIDEPFGDDGDRPLDGLA